MFKGQGRPRGVSGNPLFYVLTLAAVVGLVLFLKWVKGREEWEDDSYDEEPTTPGYSYLSWQSNPYRVNKSSWRATHLGGEDEEVAAKAHESMADTVERHKDKGTEAHIAHFELPEMDRITAQKKLLEWLATSDKFKNLSGWHWHKGHEAHFTDDTVRGLIATQDIKKGDLVTVIASEHILSTNTFANKAKKGFVRVPTKNKNGEPYTPLYRIMMYMLEHVQKPDSPWRAYIDALPREVDYNNFLVNWTSSELMMLDDDAVLMEASKKWNDVHRKFDMLDDEAKEKWPWHAWLWAYYVVSTRVFGCKYRMCVVPLADNYNTADNVKMNTIWEFSKTANDFIIKATRDIKKGDEIFTKYGNHDNRHYLAHYGFVMPTNNEDLLTFRFTIDSGKKDAVKKRTKNKMSYCQLSNGDLYCSVKRKNMDGMYKTMLSVATKAQSEKRAAKTILEQAEFYAKEHDGSTVLEYRRSGLEATRTDRMDIIERFHSGYLVIAEKVKELVEKTLKKYKTGD